MTRSSQSSCHCFCAPTQPLLGLSPIRQLLHDDDDDDKKVKGENEEDEEHEGVIALCQGIHDALWHSKGGLWNERAVKTLVREDTTITACDPVLHDILEGERGTKAIRSCGHLMIVSRIQSKRAHRFWSVRDLHDPSSWTNFTI